MHVTNQRYNLQTCRPCNEHKEHDAIYVVMLTSVIIDLHICEIATSLVKYLFFVQISSQILKQHTIHVKNNTT